jgi:thiaminase/transcriptional activator TenA
MDDTTAAPTAASLWEATLPVAEACLAHPFVTGIADGTLARDAFRHYVGQDAFFLGAFARAYALGLARSDDQAMLLRFKALLDGAVEELELHAGYADQWDVDLAPSPTAATRAYTDFLLRTAALRPLPELAAAMTPCMRLYAWLGQSLREQADPESPYHEWVQTYASEDFDALATELEDLLDTLAARAGGASEAVRHAYATAMELELAFFASAHDATGTASA